MYENFTGAYVPLSRAQRQVVDLLRPHEGEDGFFDGLAAGTVDVGLPMKVVLATLSELQVMGGAGLYYRGGADDGAPLGFVLSSSVRDYEGALRRHLLEALLDVLAKFLSGASGGLAVWALTRLLD